MKKCLLPVLGILLLLSGCGGSKAVTKTGDGEPAWATSVPSDSEYMYFVGYVESMGTVAELRPKALDNALGQLVKYIMQDATVQQNFKSFGDLTGSEGIQQTFQEDISTKAKAQVSGLEIDKSKAVAFNDSGLVGNRVWVLGKISKANVKKEQARIAAELRRKMEMIEKNIREVEDALKSGRIIDAVNAYISAAIAAVKVDERKGEIPVYLNQAGNILQNIYLETVETPKMIDSSEGGEVKFRVMYAGKTGKVPVQGAGLRFALRNNTGDWSKQTVTDKDGIAVCKISRLKKVGFTKIYANLNVSVKQMTDVMDTYKNQYSTMVSFIEKVNATASFSVKNLANLKITTSVIALANTGDSYDMIKNMTSEIASYMQKKGFTIKKFPSGMNLKNVYEQEQSALNTLKNKGIKRVFILNINKNVEEKFTESIGMYRAMYNVSAALLDTTTGEVVFTENVRIGGNSREKGGSFDAFVKQAGARLQRLIDSRM